MALSAQEQSPDVSTAAREDASRISAIDGLRAIAMIAVVAEHSKLLSFGWMGVWLFYVISGFVVTGSIADHAQANSSTSSQISGFYLRRVARIWPVYFVWVLIAASVSACLRSGPPLEALASLVFFYNNFALAAGTGAFPAFDIGNLWTVSVEMQFYAIYGLLLILAPRRLTIAVLAVLLVACPAARWMYGEGLVRSGVPPLDAAFKVYSFSALHFDAFAVGCLLALFRSRLSLAVGLSLLAAAAVALLAYGFVYVSMNADAALRGSALIRNVVSGILIGGHKEAFVYIPPVLAAAGLIALSVAAPLSVRPLTAPVLQHIGRISYGAYIFHVQVLYWTGRLAFAVWRPHGVTIHAEHAAVFIVTLMVTLLLAQLSFTYLETPISRAAATFLKRSANRRRLAYVAAA